MSCFISFILRKHRSTADMIILEALPFKLTLALIAFLNTPPCDRQSN